MYYRAEKTQIWISKAFVIGVIPQGELSFKKLDYFNQFDNFKFENKDIHEIDRLVDCDYIINTAAETHVDNSIRKSEVFFQSNISGVYHLVELLRSYCKESQIFPTSASKKKFTKTFMEKKLNTK
jgi:dTDP-D-glucose 4,6-dehydratase